MEAAKVVVNTKQSVQKSDPGLKDWDNYLRKIFSHTTFFRFLKNHFSNTNKVAMGTCVVLPS